MGPINMLKKHSMAIKASGLITQQLTYMKSVVAAARNHKAAHSFSQCGEDLISNFLFENYLRIPYPAYLDIGAHHPTYLSNTYFFYQKGCAGVCVEPDPTLYEVIRKKRPRDICVNAGVGASPESAADFYVMTERTLNTFSKKEADRYQSYGTQKIEAVVKIPLFSVNKILSDNFSSCPNFLSLDVEGLDLLILQSFDFNQFRPEVFCIETLTYVEDKSQQKIQEIIRHMEHAGYFVYADTFINTIFVDKKSWNSRK
jgi:FkbM family methyltransferase